MLVYKEGLLVAAAIDDDGDKGLRSPERSLLDNLSLTQKVSKFSLQKIDLI